MLAGDTRDAGVNLEVAFLRPCLASGAQSSEGGRSKENHGKGPERRARAGARLC